MAVQIMLTGVDQDKSTFDVQLVRVQVITYRNWWGRIITRTVTTYYGEPITQGLN